MKGYLAIVLFLFFSHSGSAQISPEPALQNWKDNSNQPYVFYITGDGGQNKFSTAVCELINKSNYGITALNAKVYFWDKKTPEQSAKDLDDYLSKVFSGRKNQQLILIGYSFGADVLPFMVNRLSAVNRAKLISLILLSPSSSTDFEVHWSELLGFKKKRAMAVAPEVNKLGLLKTAAIFGSDEDDFPVKEVTLKNFFHETLPGGHHFDGNTDEVVKTMMKYFH